MRLILFTLISLGLLSGCCLMDLSHRGSCAACQPAPKKEEKPKSSQSSGSVSNDLTD